MSEHLDDAMARANASGTHFTRLIEAKQMSADEKAAHERSAQESARQDLDKIAQAHTETDRFCALPSAATAAFLVGEFDLAAELAAETLVVAEQHADDWNYGNAVHAGHTVLGLLALRKGDSSAALASLASAGETPGSPQLNSFGPSMQLAKALLQRGERVAVLKYFEQCRQFWKAGAGTLDIWVEKVSRGEIPHFFFLGYR